MNGAYLRGIYLRLAGAITLVVTLALVVNALLSDRTFERALAPEMAKKVATVGSSIRALVLKAAENGIDFRELYGVEQKFDEVKGESPEIASFAITDNAGTVLYQRLTLPEQAIAHFRSAPVLAALTARAAVPLTSRVGDQYIVSLPIASADRSLGMLHLGVDVHFVDDVVLEMLYDVLVVLVVSLFFALELLHFIAGARLEASLKAVGDAFARGAAGEFASPARRAGSAAFAAVLQLLESTLQRVNEAYAALARELDAARRGPAHERPPGLADAQAGMQALARRFRFGSERADAGADDDGQLARLRAPLFVFILAEELTRSFLPSYVKQLLVPVAWLSPQIMVGLPIALFMLIVAVAQPYFGFVCERFGQRRCMLVGAAVAATGFAATALAATVFDLLVWRSLCAAGYAMVFVAGQSYVLEHASASNRAKSFAVFVGAIMVATVCGPSIGGILADNIGERATFGVAALLALSSLATIWRLPESQRGDERPTARVPALAEIGALLANRRFMTVTALAAVPAKILLTGVCFYLVPLYVSSVGSTQAMAGRVLMLYAVMMVLLAPLGAAWATSRERMEWLVGAGLLVSGAGGLLLLAGGEMGWVFLAVTLIGAGQALSISAQSALVSEHCDAEIARVGEGAVYGVYRLLERLGNAVGPLAAAALVMALDYRTSFVAIGAFVMLCGAAFLLATQRAPAVVVATAYSSRSTE